MCLTKEVYVLDKNIICEIKELDSLIIRKNINYFKDLFGNPAGFRQNIIIVYLIDHQNEKVYQKDLEKLFDIRRSTITGILKTMEKNSLIKRLDSVDDGRCKEVILTESAKNNYKNLRFFLNKLESNLVGGISEKDLHTFFKVVDKMKENLR